MAQDTTLRDEKYPDITLMQETEAETELPQVSADLTDDWLLPLGDNLAGHYSAVANDGRIDDLARTAAMLFSLGEGHLNDGSFEEALKAGNEALSQFRGSSDMMGMADASRLIVLAHCGRGERKRANELAKEYFSAFDRDDFQPGRAKMLLSIAEINYDKRGSKNRTLAKFAALDALDLFRRQGDEKMQASTLITLCHINLKERSGPKENLSLEACEFASEARRLYCNTQDRRGESLAVHNLATAFFAMQDVESALKASQEALRLFQSLGDKKLEVFELQCLSMWQLRSKHRQDALFTAEKALNVAREIDSRQDLEASALHHLVKIKAELRADDVLKTAKDGWRRLRNSDNKKAESQALNAVVSASLAEDDLEEALVAAKKVKTNCLRLGDVEGEHLALRVISELQLRSGDLDQAADAGQQALAYFQSVNDKQETVNSLLVLARVRLVLGEFGSALQLAKEAQEMAVLAGYRRGEAESLRLACGAHTELKQMSEALVAGTQAQRIVCEDGDKQGEAEVLTLMAEMHMKQADYNSALICTLRIIALSQDLQDRHNEVKALLLDVQCRLKVLVQRTTETGEPLLPLDADWEKMYRHAQRSVTLARKCCDRRLVAATQLTMAEALLLSANTEAALGAAFESASLSRLARDKATEAAALELSATCHHMLEEMDACRDVASRALDIYREIGDWPAGSRVADFLQNTLTPQYEASQRKAPAASAPSGQPATASMPLSNTGMLSLSQAKVATLNENLEGRQAVDLGIVSRDLVLLKVREVLQENLGLDEEEFLNDTPLMQQGVTSRGAVLLQAALSVDFPGVQLPPTLIFEQPSISAVAGFIMARVT